MPDVFSKAKRSQVMSRIRGRGNKNTELLLVRVFRAEGIIGWRRHSALFGSPDFTFRKHRLVVFVDGCFWHCCPKHATAPKNNADYWRKKLDRNVERDRLVNRTLRKAGWHVLRIWEHDLPRRADYWVRRIKRLRSEG